MADSTDAKSSTDSNEPARARKSHDQRSPTSLTGIVLIAVIFLIGVVIWKQRPIDPIGMGHPAVGTRLSKLNLQPLTGAKKHVTLDDLSERVTLINYWGVWCPPCRQEFPHIVALEKEFEGQEKFQLFSVSCPPTPQGDLEILKEVTKAFLKRELVEMDTYADPKARSMIGLAQDTESDGSFPTTVLVGKKGEIRALWQGYAPGYELQMHTAIKKVLAERD